MLAGMIASSGTIPPVSIRENVVPAFDPPVNSIARDSRLIADDGSPFPDETVEQRRLSTFGRPMIATRFDMPCSLQGLNICVIRGNLRL